MELNKINLRPFDCLVLLAFERNSGDAAAVANIRNGSKTLPHACQPMMRLPADRTCCAKVQLLDTGDLR